MVEAGAAVPQVLHQTDRSLSDFSSVMLRSSGLATLFEDSVMKAYGVVPLTPLIGVNEPFHRRVIACAAVCEVGRLTGKGFPQSPRQGPAPRMRSCHRPHCL
jgi:hypothetical protein